MFLIKIVMLFDTQNLPQLIQPAILLSAIVFLIHFFGKIISDQKPFSDNRRWEIELSGVMFFANFIVLYGIIGASLAIKWNIVNSMGHWVSLFIVLFISGFIQFSTLYLTEQNYKIQMPLLEKIRSNNKILNQEVKIPYMKKKSTNRIVLGFSSLIFMYILISEYFIGDPLWFSIFAIEIFVSYLILAINYSLINIQPIIVDVYVAGQSEPVKQALLLKVNDDNLRLRQDDKIIILNKNKVDKIEMSISQNKNK